MKALFLAGALLATGLPSTGFACDGELVGVGSDRTAAILLAVKYSETTRVSTCVGKSNNGWEIRLHA